LIFSGPAQISQIVMDLCTNANHALLGTGMGLADAQSIAANGKGGVIVRRETVKATTFQVYLPIAGMGINHQLRHQSQILPDNQISNKKLRFQRYCDME